MTPIGVPATTFDGRNIWDEGGFIEYELYLKLDISSNFDQSSEYNLNGNYKLRYSSMVDGYMKFEFVDIDPEIEQKMDSVDPFFVDPFTGKDKISDDWAGVFTNLSKYKTDDIVEELGLFEYTPVPGTSYTDEYKIIDETITILDGNREIPVYKVGFDGTFSWTNSYGVKFKEIINKYYYLSVTNGVLLKQYFKDKLYYYDELYSSYMYFGEFIGIQNAISSTGVVLVPPPTTSKLESASLLVSTVLPLFIAIIVRKYDRLYRNMGHGVIHTR